MRRASPRIRLQGLLLELLQFLRRQRKFYVATIQTHENILANIKRRLIDIFRFAKSNRHFRLEAPLVARLALLARHGTASRGSTLAPAFAHQHRSSGHPEVFITIPVTSTNSNEQRQPIYFGEARLLPSGVGVVVRRITVLGPD